MTDEVAEGTIDGSSLPSKIILLNAERVLYECLELARLKIADKLKIHPSAVTVTVNTGDDKKFKAEFKLDDSAKLDISEDEVKKVITMFYSEARSMITERMSTLHDRWAG